MAPFNLQLWYIHWKWVRYKSITPFSAFGQHHLVHTQHDGHLSEAKHLGKTENADPSLFQARQLDFPILLGVAVCYSPVMPSIPICTPTRNHFIGWKETWSVGTLQGIHLPYHCINKKNGRSRILSDLLKVTLPFSGRSGTKHKSPESLERAMCSLLSLGNTALGFDPDLQ